MIEINAFDCDGVISIPNGGVYPGPNDVIITGRSYQEHIITQAYLATKGIFNDLYCNGHVDIDSKTDATSAMHKVNIILHLNEDGKKVINFFEDNEVQAKIIKKWCPWVNIILLTHDLVTSTECENY